MVPNIITKEVIKDSVMIYHRCNTGHMEKNLGRTPNQ
jgi:hypothetical protein